MKLRNIVINKKENNRRWTFKLYDKDGSGEIDPDEMEDVFKKLCKIAAGIESDQNKIEAKEREEERMREIKELEKTYAIFLLDKKSKLIFDIKFLLNEKEKFRLLFSPFLLRYSTITLVINTAEKKEQIIPIISVTANPFTGPCPKLYKIIPTKRVVALASIIEV